MFDEGVVKYKYVFKFFHFILLGRDFNKSLLSYHKLRMFATLCKKILFHRLQLSFAGAIISYMKIDLSEYRGMNICVAVSGGRDSMALLHYLLAHGAEYGISVSAVNFDHKMRGESSARDSMFVNEYCKEHGVPLFFYEWDDTIGQKTESLAHFWRFKKYLEAVQPCILPNGKEWKGADAVATAHHLNDNAETVLFNLARGSGLSGLTGITDNDLSALAKKTCKIIRPLIACSREEIDAYIAENNIPYVEDETNFTDDYTRNKIRHNVLPELEKAVPNAAKAIYRFSRIAAEDEEYFENLIKERGLIKRTALGYEIAHCPEKSVFKRAVLQVLSCCGVKDYTSEHLERLYELQFAEKGKKFEFLGLVVFKEEGKIAICIEKFLDHAENGCPFKEYYRFEHSKYFGQILYIEWESYFNDEWYDSLENPKTLKFDFDKISQSAVVRFMREGDKFKKFGGGTKNLGDYFTDKKIPVRIRKNIPVVADGSQILIVCGVEISDSVKVDEYTKTVALCVAEDYVNY